MGILEQYTKRVYGFSDEELKNNLDRNIYTVPGNSGQGFGQITNNLINYKFKDATTFRNIVVYRNNETFSFRIDSRVNDIERMGSIRRLLFRPITVNTIVNLPDKDIEVIQPPFNTGDRWIMKYNEKEDVFNNILVKNDNWNEIRGEFLVNAKVYEALVEKTEDETSTIEDWHPLVNNFNKDKLVRIGDILYFDDDYWMVYDMSGSLYQGASVEAQRINNKLSWITKNGDKVEVKAIMGKGMLGSKSQMRAGQVEINPYGVNLPVSTIRGFVEWNKYTDEIKLGHRFIIGKNVYKVISVDDMSFINYENNTGVIQLILDITTIIPEKDDFENNIAYNVYETDENIVEDTDEPIEESWGW